MPRQIVLLLLYLPPKLMMTIMSWYTKVFGDPNDKQVKKYKPLVERINALEPAFEALDNEALKAKTAEFQARLQDGETTDNILAEAFATVREAAKRTLGMRPFDVQLIGGMAIHNRTIAEMRTGEGKTLVATLPTYLNALTGKGVHVITVNDYLAKRDAIWMADIYDFLGLSVGIIQNQRVSYVYDASIKGTTKEEIEAADETKSFQIEEAMLRTCTRKESYACDITYGTNNEFGFDYLRDNMVQRFEDLVMRQEDPTHFAIIDEIDSILIDEARTPLIISAPAEEATEMYYRFAKIVKSLKENEDYNIDEKLKSASLSDDGMQKVEEMLGIENIYASEGVRTVHHLEEALKAEVLFDANKDYIVEENQVIIIDEFTGRKMPGRRFSGGLHQALEAKEGVEIQRESQTLATITFQNLFRMYEKLAGMTGTAETEKEEFYKIYQMDVLVIPTNKPIARLDHADRIYRSEVGKFGAVAEKIKECRAKGQPILIGTISVDKNEALSAYLTKEGIAHEALNAKNHEREGEIVAQAGRPGAVTLATNMAGRGVDIKLGGSPQDPETEAAVLAAGGLFVLGTERHESRRIDNQLRGRSGRQGDAGETQFFVCADDDLMRIFGGDRLKNLMTTLKVPEDMPIELKMVSRSLEKAQERVEGHHFDSRKHVLQYDDVLSRHRGVVYGRRRAVLELYHQAMKESSEDASPSIIVGDSEYTSIKDMILEMVESEIEFVVSFHTNPDKNTDLPAEEAEWNMKEIVETMKTVMPLTNDEQMHLKSMGNRDEDSKLSDVESRDAIVNYLIEKSRTTYDKMEEMLGANAPEDVDTSKLMREVEKSLLIRAMDTLWVEHLVAIDYLRHSIGLRGYAQRDPLIEYKRETYHMFNDLLANIQKEVAYTFFKVNIGVNLAPSIMANDKAVAQGAKKSNAVTQASTKNAEGEKVGRNDACPCGSGKKYKKCHGK
jgi:preprotein translocase subunit SecA